MTLKKYFKYKPQLHNRHIRKYPILNKINFNFNKINKNKAKLHKI